MLKLKLKKEVDTWEGTVERIQTCPENAYIDSQKLKTDTGGKNGTAK